MLIRNVKSSGKELSTQTQNGEKLMTFCGRLYPSGGSCLRPPSILTAWLDNNPGATAYCLRLLEECVYVKKISGLER